MHVSNRHLELSSVVVGIADANGLKSWVFSEDANRDGEYIFSTTVVLSARDEADIGRLATDDKWTLTEAEARPERVDGRLLQHPRRGDAQRLQDGEE